MRRLRKFLGLPPGDRRLLIRAALLVPAVRLILWLLPFQSSIRMLEKRVPGRGGRAGDDPLPDRIVWAVEAAARYVPRATCLTQALAAQTLLNREGFPAELRIGVAKDGNGRLQAHAWLEKDGKILMGDCQGENYIPFHNLPGFSIKAV